jgi:hypothetical protein
LIFFRDPSTGDLYPIRKFTRVKSDKLSADAEIVVIDFCVSEFPKTAQKLSELLNQNPSLNHPKHPLFNLCKFSQDSKGDTPESMVKIRLVQTIECANDREKLDIFDRLLGQESKDELEDEERWVGTVKSLNCSENMQYSCFLYLREMLDQHGKKVRESTSRGFLSAPAGTYYTAKVTQFCLENTKLVTKAADLTEALDTPIEIEMSTDHDHIRILEGKYTLDGLYDGCELTFKTETDAAGANTAFTIGQSQINPDKSPKAPDVPAPAGNSIAGTTGPTITNPAAANPAERRAAFVPTITVALEITHATWQWAVLFVGALFLLGGFFLNATNHVSPLLKKAKDAQLITITIAIGATLTTWLGKDFWATIFRRSTILWTGAAALVNGWLFALGIALGLIGLSMVGYLKSAEHWVSSKITTAVIWIEDLINSHSFSVGCCVLGVGIVCCVYSVIKFRHVLREAIDRFVARRP